MKKNIKQLTSLLLAGVLCFSAAACGKEEPTVDDYGTTDTEIESTNASTGTSTSTDSISISTGDAQSLRDIYGDSVSYQDDFSVGTAEINASAYYEVPDKTYMSVYNMQKFDDGKKDEQAIVDSLFGDTATKLESIGYTNEYDNMTLLYKYRQIMSAHEIYKNSDDFKWVPYEKEIITPANAEEYYWKDADDIYIHMYEGDYNNTKFVLLLAYDYTANFRYIFFEPKSIKDYFPDYDFETLMVAGSRDSAGTPLEIDNQCSEDIDTIKENAKSFIDNELHLNDMFGVTDDGRNYKNSTVDSIIDEASSINMIDPFFQDDNHAPGNSVLMFSDCDFLSTLMTRVPGAAIDYKVLSEQRDLLQEFKIENPASTQDYSEFIYSDSAANLMDVANYTIDGYAVYLEDYNYFDISNEGGDNTSFAPITYNSGIIKYTSNGLYSVDIRLSNKIIDAVENVKLLEFDKIKTSFQSAVEENLNLDELGYPNNLNVISVYLFNVDYYEDKKSDTYVSIPAWQFQIQSQGNNGGIATVYINAMDGSLIDIKYQTFE